MSTQNRRPLFLNLLLIRFPLTAIASGCHRLSGIFVFLLLPCLIGRLQRSLADEAGFAAVQAEFASIWIKIVLVLGLAALIYHLFAGIRHLLMDINIGESAAGGMLGAKIVFLSAIIATIGVMVWLF